MGSIKTGLIHLFNKHNNNKHYKKRILLSASVLFRKDKRYDFFM